MTVSYDEAREIVIRATEPQWAVGTFCLDDRRIVENDTMYMFEVGAREYLVDGDDSYAIAGSVPAVRKADGTLQYLPSVVVATDPTIRSRSNPHATFTGN